MQVEAVNQLSVDTVQYCHPATKNIIFQSDNASGFASQELMPFIFNMDTILDGEKNIVLSRWTFT